MKESGAGKEEGCTPEVGERDGREDIRGSNGGYQEVQLSHSKQGSQAGSRDIGNIGGDVESSSRWREREMWAWEGR